MDSPKVAWPGGEERKVGADRGQRGNADNAGNVIGGENCRISENRNDGRLCHSSAFVGDYYR